MLRELINKLNEQVESEIIQSCYEDDGFIHEDFENVPEELDYEAVHHSNVDEHRWYGLQDIVFKLKLGEEELFVMTTIVTQSYSESQSLSDIYHSYPEFQIMKPVIVKGIVYKKEKNNEG